MTFTMLRMLRLPLVATAKAKSRANFVIQQAIKHHSCTEQIESSSGGRGSEPQLSLEEPKGPVSASSKPKIMLECVSLALLPW